MHTLITGACGKLEIDYEFQANNLAITGIICHPHPLFGGTMNNKVVTTVAKSLQHLNISTIRFNFRGVGQSVGNYNEGMGEVDDLLAVAQWLKHERPTNQLWLAGFSFGAYIAAKGATLLPARQLITVAPAVNHANFSDLTITCPWLIIQGEEDEIVPPNDVYQLAATKIPPPTLIKIPNASHFFHHKLGDLAAAVNTLVHCQPKFG